jgi:hypothetical protein
MEGFILDEQDEHSFVRPVLAEIHVLEGHAVPEALGGLRHGLRADVSGGGDEEMLGFKEFGTIRRAVGEDEFVVEALEGGVVDAGFLFDEAGFSAGDDGFRRAADFDKVLAVGEAEVLDLETPC